MRVSLIAPELTWAVTRTLHHQLHYFYRRGDEPVVFTPSTEGDLPAHLASSFQIAEGQETELSRLAYFAASDLYIYHCSSAHPLLETVRTIERGVVILHCHLPPIAMAEVVERNGPAGSLAFFEPLAPFADILVADSTFTAKALLARGIAESDRVCTLRPAIPLDIFVPGPPPLPLLQQHGWTDHQVILAIAGRSNGLDAKVLAQAAARVRMSYPGAILAIAQTEHSQSNIDAGDFEIEGITTLCIENGNNLLPYYRSAAIYLSLGIGIDDTVHALEAMACGIPVVGIASGAQETIISAAGLSIKPGDPDSLVDRIACLLSEDDTYGEMVRRGYRVAADHALESYWFELGDIIAAASAWLPYREHTETLTVAPLQVTARAIALSPTDDPAPDSAVEGWQLPAEIEQVKAAASIMLKDYRVRSTLPIFGPLIAWLRRNLTSHLREPYVDPILQNQELFNQQAAMALEELARQLTAYRYGLKQETEMLEERHHELQTIARALQEQVDNLLATLSDIPSTSSPNTDRSLSVTQTRHLRAILEDSRAKLAKLQK